MLPAQPKAPRADPLTVQETRWISPAAVEGDLPRATDGSDSATDSYLLANLRLPRTRGKGNSPTRAGHGATVPES